MKNRILIYAVGTLVLSIIISAVVFSLSLGTYEPIPITAYAQTLESYEPCDTLVIEIETAKVATCSNTEETETETESEKPKELWYEYNGGKSCTTTCYCLCPKCCGKNYWKNITASGAVPQRYVTVANGALPFGTEVFIEDVGYRIVQDRGSKVGKNHFDIYVGVDNHAYAASWTKRNKKVWIVKRG